MDCEEGILHGLSDVIPSEKGHRQMVSIIMSFITLIILQPQSQNSGEAGSSDPAERRRAFEAQYSSFEYAKSLVKDQPPEKLVELTFEDLPGEIQMRMYNSLAFILQWEAHPQKRGHPHEGGNFTIHAFAAEDKSQDDLVEYRWRYCDIDLRALASVNAIKLDIDLDDLSACRDGRQTTAPCLSEARELVSKVLRLDGADTWGTKHEFAYIILPWPDSLQDGMHFSSAPDQNLLRISRWWERVDVFVEPHVLSILTYKKIPQLMDYSDGSTWFSDDFKRAVREKSRNRDVPPKGTEGNK